MAWAARVGVGEIQSYVKRDDACTRRNSSCSVVAVAVVDVDLLPYCCNNNNSLLVATTYPVVTNN